MSANFDEWRSLLSGEKFLLVPDSGVSRWTFDDADTSSGTAIDSWGSNDGTINGATTGVTGANQTYATGEAYSFDGTDDYVSLPDISLTENLPYSIAAWVYLNDSGTLYVVFSEEYSPNQSVLTNFVIDDRSGNNHFKFNLRNASGSSTQVTYPFDANTDTGKWFHMVATNDGTMTLYINGQQRDTASDPGGDQTTNGTAIGARPIKSDFYWSGAIDDVRIYDKALTSQEVSNLYNNGDIRVSNQ